MATAYSVNILSGELQDQVEGNPSMGYEMSVTTITLISVLALVIYAALVAVVIQYANSKIREEDKGYRILAYLGAALDPVITGVILLFLPDYNPDK